MSYLRVLPRDLFNEAKLLKCLGQLSLILHDGVGIRWPMALEFLSPSRGFVIDQDPGDASLRCTNLRLMFRGFEIPLHTNYNSKDPYPLLFTNWDGDEGSVFDDTGKLAEEFTAWLDSQSPNEQQTH